MFFLVVLAWHDGGVEQEVPSGCSMTARFPSSWNLMLGVPAPNLVKSVSEAVQVLPPSSE